MRAASCESSAPASGAYTVTVCLTEPGDGAVLSGMKTVTATASVGGASPGVQKVVFYLNDGYLLTDYSAPYTFSLPTAKDADGIKLLEASPVMRDGFVARRAGVTVTFLNGNTEAPTNTNSFSPRTGTSPPAGRPLVLAAAGDGADGVPNAGQVTDLIASWNPNMFLYLGDVYEKASVAEFHNWYGTSNAFFGRFRAITNPTIGNHEYEGREAPGYFDYWDNVPHYYSVNAGGWHFIALDSTSQYSQLDPGTDQYEWLKRDLASNPNNCTIAFFHHPRYNVGPEGAAERLSGVWSLLAQHGVELVLTGHDHDYQRWTALDRNGQPDPGGVTQFVVGTAGHGIQSQIMTDARMVKGFDSPPDSFGALRMELNARGASYQFINVKGTVLDSGSVPCTGAAADSQAPSPPTDVKATAVGSHQVDLGWTSATDDVGVTAYRIYRDGSLIATRGPGTTFSDLTVSAEITYRYEVRAVDAAGNESGASNSVGVTTRSGQTGVFTDDFETGNLSRWNVVTGLVAQQAQVFSGAWAARGTSTGASTYAYKTLSQTRSELYFRIRFKVASMASNTVNLLKFRTNTGGSLLGLYISGSGKLGYRNDVGAVSTTSTTSVSTGVWHDAQVRLVVSGGASQVETWFDGARVDALSKPESLGTTPIGRLQIGENSTGKTYDIAYDTVVADTSYVVTDTSAPSVPAGLTATASSATSVRVAWSAAIDNVAVTGYSVYRDGVFLAGVPAGSLTYTDGTLEPSTTYRYTLDAFDGAGNHSAQSAPASVTTPADTTPPSPPSSVRISGRGTTEIDIAWAAARDDVGVTRYDIYR
ncbi:MAG: metallophosphoesterase, partial [Chloroflexota bacterium]|nr:metallophosphoesterase [Chloroflexota bacterium]